MKLNDGKVTLVFDALVVFRFYKTALNNRPKRNVESILSEGKLDACGGVDEEGKRIIFLDEKD